MKTQRNQGLPYKLLQMTGQFRDVFNWHPHPYKIQSNGTEVQKWSICQPQGRKWGRIYASGGGKEF